VRFTPKLARGDPTEFDLDLRDEQLDGFGIARAPASKQFRKIDIQTVIPQGVPEF
jgi:hypothetical protein